MIGSGVCLIAGIEYLPVKLFLYWNFHPPDGGWGRGVDTDTGGVCWISDAGSNKGVLSDGVQTLTAGETCTPRPRGACRTLNFRVENSGAGTGTAYLPGKWFRS